MKDVFSKKMIFVIVAGLIVAFLLALLVAISVSKPKGDTNTVGIRNDKNILETEQVTKEDLEQQQAQKEEIRDLDLASLDIHVTQNLSTGDYKALDTYLQELENNYRESTDPAIMLKMERVHGLRQDMAMFSGINVENGKNLLKSFFRAESLCSALLYLPLQTKYEAFMNISAIAIPSMKEESVTVNLKEKPYTDKESEAILADLNNRWSRSFVDIARYSAMVAEKEIEIVVVQDSETTFWRPYTIRPADGDMTGFISVRQVKDVANQLIVAHSIDQLDDVISYTDPSSTFAGDEPMPNRQPNTSDDLDFEQ